MKPRALIPALAVCLLSAATATLSAEDVLVTYGLNSTNLAGVASNVAPSITAESMTAFADGAAAGNFGFSGSNGQAFSRLSSVTSGGSALLATNLADALTGTRYFAFTLTPKAEQTISMGSVSFDMIIQNISPTPPATTTYNAFEANFALVASLGGQDYTIGTSSMLGQTSSGIRQGGTATFDLTSVSGVDFSAVTSAVTFKIYLYTTGTETNYYETIRFTNLTVNTPAPNNIPEPAHTALILAGALGLLLFTYRRFRRVG
ncbi:hypothetical protein OPIT5_27585 [Opitutaceae bacterium TAV5]|nr:hypothetical protein OPIT5_27585 [Opitutaceae bacterium TAV5]